MAIGHNTELRGTVNTGMLFILMPFYTLTELITRSVENLNLILIIAIDFILPFSMWWSTQEMRSWSHCIIKTWTKLETSWGLPERSYYQSITPCHVGSFVTREPIYFPSVDVELKRHKLSIVCIKIALDKWKPVAFAIQKASFIFDLV